MSAAAAQSKYTQSVTYSLQMPHATESWRARGVSALVINIDCSSPPADEVATWEAMQHIAHSDACRGGPFSRVDAVVQEPPGATRIARLADIVGKAHSVK